MVRIGGFEKKVEELTKGKGKGKRRREEVRRMERNGRWNGTESKIDRREGGNERERG